jgi:hypothetical protein
VFFGLLRRFFRISRKDRSSERSVLFDCARANVSAVRFGLETEADVASYAHA